MGVRRKNMLWYSIPVERHRDVKCESNYCRADVISNSNQFPSRIQNIRIFFLHHVAAPGAHPKETTAEFRPPTFPNMEIKQKQNACFVKMMISFAVCDLLSRQNQRLKGADD